jgi:hypothetical protein
MTNRKSTIDFTDLEDWDNVEVSADAETQPIEKSIDEWTNRSASSQGAIYEEKCKDCRGSGKFYSYTGRYVGPCFKCKGTGKLTFKTSPESRAKAAETRAKKRQEKKTAEIMRRANKFQAWCNDNEDVAAFLKAGAEWSDFYKSLWESAYKYGSLTDKQLAAVQRGMAKAQANKSAEPETGLDLSDLPSGYYAVPDGDTRLKVRVNRPGKDSNWHGWIFVSDGAAYGHRKNYGRQGPGKKYSGQITEQLKAIMADPATASKEYGKLVGCCGVCGRKLEDEHSVEAGIGPICAQKMGW